MKRLLHWFVNKIKLKKVLSRLITLINIDEVLTNKKIESLKSNVRIDEKSRFYAETKIFNLSLNPDNIVIMSNTHIRGELLVYPSGGKIIFGKNCYLGENSKIWSQNHITIGNNVLISHNVNIHDTNSHPLDLIDRRKDYLEMIHNGHAKVNMNVVTKPIKIEDDVWIGFNVIILKGVTIGKGAIIGAGSVVTKDIPSFSLAIGNPAKVVKKLMTNVL